MIMNKQQYEIARKYVEGFNARLRPAEDSLLEQIHLLVFLHNKN